MLFIAFMAVLMLGVITGVGLGLVLGYWIGFYSRPANDSTVCNSCRCAFCEDKPGQIIDLCEDHAEVESLHTALRDAERERDALRGFVESLRDAYQPDIIPPPTSKELQAVNETPEFRVGRNGAFAHVSKMCREFLEEVDG